MSMKCSEIINILEEFAPSNLAEEWDNVGLLIGSRENKINKILVCLDVTSSVVDEAIEKNIDLVISHHPLIFKSIKRISSDNVTGLLISKLIKNDINCFCAHTNLDTAFGGVNDCLAEKIGLIEISNLKKYKTEKLFKIAVFVPEDSIEKVRTSICNAGAGWIGKYKDCTFLTEGSGTFRPLEGTKPYIGSLGQLEKVKECRIETVVPEGKLKRVILAMIEAHPYEEVAYDLYPLELNSKEFGLGKVGVLKTPLDLVSFIALIKDRLKVRSVRVVGALKKDIKKVAVFCGSFDNDLVDVLNSGADILVTGDIKYHIAQEIVDLGMCVVDAGHFNTEIVILNKVKELIEMKTKGLDIFISTMEEDPFKSY
jgi:dinuclear metal center YbgI/SA1388 family protein